MGFQKNLLALNFPLKEKKIELNSHIQIGHVDHRGDLIFIHFQNGSELKLKREKLVIRLKHYVQVVIHVVF